MSQLLIFDFDGTLADSFPWFLGVANSVADRYGFRRVEPDEVERLRGMRPRELLGHMNVSLWKLPLIARHVRRLLSEQIDQLHLFDGVEALLPTLRARGVRLALVTSNSEANARRVLGPANAALFEFFECNVSLFGKARRYRRVLQRSGIAPHAALCIGDELRDLEAAASAGIPFGAVAWGFARPDVLAAYRPAALFHRVEEISALYD